MAAPLALGIPLLGKAWAAIKGLGATKAALGGAKATQLTIPGLAKAGAAKTGLLGNAKRMAGDALVAYLGEKPTAGNLAMNFGFDAGFGVLQGINTPGDLGDKLIAGTTTAIGGGLGGVGTVGATRALTGKTPQGALRMGLEFGGGYGGDMLGQMVGDSLLRAKGGGTTPWEKIQMDADQEYRQQLEREMLAKIGMGGYNVPDLFMQENGLG